MLRAKIGPYAAPALYTDRLNKRQDGRRFQGAREFNVDTTSQDRHRVMVEFGSQIMTHEVGVFLRWNVSDFKDLDEQFLSIKAAGVSDSRFTEAG